MKEKTLISVETLKEDAEQVSLNMNRSLKIGDIKRETFVEEVGEDILKGLMTKEGLKKLNNKKMFGVFVRDIKKIQMKISDLQKELRKIKRKHGDLNLKIEDIFEGYFHDSEIKTLEVKEFKGVKYGVLK